MSTRREFFGLLPAAGAALLGACGGSADSSNTPVAREPDQGTTDPATKEDKVPAFVVLEDWSTGAAVDAGRIDFSTLIRRDTFSDANLAADCLGWEEHGPAAVTALPSLNGVQFSAKRFTIAAGGRYSQISYRVLVMMRATGLKDGLFGDAKGVSTFPGPHKLRITNAGGVELKRIEMRDGLPMNHASLVNVPINWTVTNRPDSGPPDINFSGYRLPNNKAMRPHMSAGSSYVAFFGDQPLSSDRVRTRIPRVDLSLWPSKNSKVRFMYNGDDVHLMDPRGYGGNGNAHPEVMPRWAMSYDEVDATVSVVKSDTEILATQGYNWGNALRVGWDYEPGALGGITRRGGPGGVRMDRTALPSEIVQMALTQATRTNDGTSTADMARGYALNHANYPGYYPRSMATLDAINTFSEEPQPNISGREITPVRHYYGSNGAESSPGAVFIYDVYGNPPHPVAQAIEWANPGSGSSASTKNHPRNGWTPDSEHNNRCGNAWSTLLYSDPLFTRMAEHMMMFESHIMNPIVARATWAIYGSNPNLLIEDPDSFWSSRSNVLPFCTAAMMWWVASESGVYQRSLIEERIHSFFLTYKTTVRDKIPSTTAAITASQRAFNLTGGLSVFWTSWDKTDHYAAGSGWVANFGLGRLYLGQFFTILKCSGLYEVLNRNPVTAACLNDLLAGLGLNARMFKDIPWAMTSVSSGPALILRTAARGAVESDLSTIPATYEELVGFNPAWRSDDHWFLASTATPGVDGVALNGNYSTHARMQTALMWWKLFQNKSTEQEAAVLAVSNRIKKLASYTPTYYDPCFTRFNSAFTVPALA